MGECEQDQPIRRSYRHSYLLIAGVLAGFLLGPSVLGVVWPGAYAWLFVGPQQAHEALVAFDQQVEDQRLRLVQSGVTGAAIEEADRRAKRGRERMVDGVRESELAYLKTLTGRAHALVLAVVVVFVFGGVLRWLWRGGADRVSGVCAVAGSGLLAGWVAMVVARPALVAGVSPVFVLLAAVVAVVAAAGTTRSG